MLNQAVILAGGRGTRLGALTDLLPKPMMPVGDGPFLEQLLWNLRRHGIGKVLLSVGYLAEVVEGHFGDGSRFELDIEYCLETEPAGTGGALKLALPQFEERFLVLNGDTLFDLNYLDLGQLLEHGEVALALREVADSWRYGSVTVAGDRVTAFAEKAYRGGRGLINGGVYAMTRRAVAAAEGSSIELDWLPQLASTGKLLGRTYSGFLSISASPTCSPERSSIFRIGVTCRRRCSTAMAFSIVTKGMCTAPRRSSGGQGRSRP